MRLSTRMQTRLATRLQKQVVSGVSGIGDELMLLRAATGVLDQSGNGNDGTYNGGMGVSGGRFVFDGVNDYISFANLTDLGMTGTRWAFFAWIKVTNLSRFHAMFSRWGGDSSDSYAHMFVRQTSGNLDGIFGDDSSFIALTERASVSAGTWHLVGYQRGSTGIEIWLDGSKLGEDSTAIDDIATPTETLVFGARPSIFDSHFLGEADDLRLFNRELTSSEWSDAYTAGVPS